MKNKQNLLFLLGLTFTFCFLFSCGNEEDETPEQNQLVGTWNYGSLDYEATIDGQDHITYIVENYGYSETEAEIMAALIVQNAELVPGSITFNQDGTFSFQNGSMEESGTYSLQNNETQLTLAPEEGDPMVFEVVELNNSTLTLDASQEEMEDLNRDGVEENLLVSFRVTYNK